MKWQDVEKRRKRLRLESFRSSAKAVLTKATDNITDKETFEAEVKTGMSALVANGIVKTYTFYCYDCDRGFYGELYVIGHVKIPGVPKGHWVCLDYEIETD